MPRCRARPAARKRPAGDLTAALRLMNRAAGASPPPSLAQKRQLVADLCRLLALRNAPPPAAPAARPVDPPTPGPALSPRMRQTLSRLLAGDSEKEIARRLGVSPHTVHVYVKTLYRRHDVCSRGELLARYVHPAAAGGGGVNESVRGELGSSLCRAQSRPRRADLRSSGHAGECLTGV